MSFRKGGSGWTSFRKEELQEEEVWGILESNDASSSTTTLRRTSTVAKMIPRSNRSSEQQPHKMMTHQHSSAPLNIPDWSKIYGGGGGAASKPAASRGGGDGFVRSSWESDEEEDDENGMMPPHEWLARKYARSEMMSSFSVCEGVGRTLKGRDISRVRNAVLTRTGFLE